MTSNKKFYFTIVELLKEGKTTKQVVDRLNISKQKLYYYTKKLKELGIIEKKGYGVWEVKRSKKEDLEHAIKWKEKKIRGHAFIWKVKTKKFNWIKILEKNKIKYNLVRGYTPRIFINKKKVWLGKNSIIIYESKSFFGKNATESRKYAVFELLSTLQALSKKAKVGLGKYVFMPSREHYGMIKNELARQCNRNGEKIIVRDDLDGEWLWVDDSEGMFGELETGGKGITKDRAHLNMNVQNWYNDHKKHGFKVTPSFLMENINKLAEVQLIEQENKKEYSRDLVEHKNAIKTMSCNTEANTQTIELLAKIVAELRDEIKSLKKGNEDL